MGETRRILNASLLADLRPALEGWADPVAFGVGYDGAVYAAARRTASEPLREDGMFAKSQFGDPVDYLVVRSDGVDVRTMTVPSLSLVVSYVQPFQAGVLLAGARCHWSSKGPEQNALVVNWSGKIERAFTIGDGVQDVRVTGEGHVWVSYFDEGIFGNYGWSSPGPTAIGVTGLVGFDAEGKVRFTYDATAAGTDQICDAYAMNVADDGAVWVYFYSEFPIVRILPRSYERWKLGISGARALAVRHRRALLFGSYEERGLGRVVTLKGEGAKVAAEVSIEDGRGGSFGDAVACGRGESLYFFKDRQAFVLESW